MTKPRVLVIEDDPGWMKLMAYWLRSCGYDAIPAGSLKDALERLEEDRDFIAILHDISLPDIWTLDSIPKLREKMPHTPIGIVSGRDNVKKSEIVELGANTILHKNVAGRESISDLMKELEGFHSGES